MVNNNIEASYSLTPMQSSKLLEILDDKSSEYILQSKIEINEKENIESIKNSLKLLALKYDILRTTISFSDLKPLQILLREGKIEFNYRDITDLKESEKKYKIQEIQDLDLNRGFEFEKESLIRATLVKIEKEKQIILWSAHCIIMDEKSMSIVLKDFALYYEMLENDDDYEEILDRIMQEKYAIVPIQEYEDWIEDQDKRKIEKYWNNLLEGYENAAQIRSLRKNQSNESFDNLIEKESVELDIDTTELIERLAFQNRTGISSIVEAALAIVIYQYTGLKDLVFGKVVSGRNPEIMGIEQSVGLFENTIPVRVKIDENTSCRELFCDIQTQSVESSNYDFYPLKSIEKESLLGDNLIKTVFTFSNFNIENFNMDKSFKMEIKENVIKEIEKYKLKFVAEYKLDKLNFKILYNPKEFHMAEVKNILGKLKNVVIGISKDQDKNAVEVEVSEEDSVRKEELIYSKEVLEEVSEYFKLNPQEIESIYIMTPEQEKMLENNTYDHVIQNELKVSGDFDLTSVTECLRLLSLKHPVLRTSLVYLKSIDRILQVVIKNKEIEFNTIDITNSSEFDKEAVINQIIEDDKKRGFKENYLARMNIIKISDTENLILWSSSHVITDGVSIEIVFKDFIDYYEALKNNVNRPDLNKKVLDEGRNLTKYSEYINWLENQDERSAINYWENLLRGYEPKTTIKPSGFAKKTNEKIRVKYIQTSEEGVEKIKEFANQNNISVNTVLETSFGLLLQKHSGYNDVVFGKFMSGRNIVYKDMKKTVGMFTYVIPERVAYSQNETYRTLLKKIDNQSNQSKKYSYYSLEKIESLNELGKLSINSVFDFQDYNTDNQIKSIDLEIMESIEDTSYPFIFVARLKDVLTLRMVYNPNDYTDEEVDEVISEFQQIIYEVLSDTDKVIQKDISNVDREIIINNEEENNLEIESNKISSNKNLYESSNEENIQIKEAKLGLSIKDRLAKIGIGKKGIDRKKPNIGMEMPDINEPNVEMEMPDIDINEKVLNIKKQKSNIKVKGSGIEIEKPEIEMEGQDIDIKVPNLNIKTPKVNVDESTDGFNINMPNVDVKAPEIEMESKDIDVKVPDLNIKTPKVNVDESKAGFNINMPNVDVKAPEIEMENKDIDVKVPDLNIKTPKVNVDESKAGFNINMPNLNIKEKLEGLGRKKVELKGPNIEIEKPEIEMECKDIDIKAPNLNIKTPKVNIDESIDGFNINMPNVDVKAPEIEMENKDIDVKVPDLNIKTPKVNVDESKAGFNINMPNLNIKEKLEGLGRKKVELKGPNIEIEKPEIEMEGQDIDIKAPNLNIKTPKVNIDESIDGFNINMPNVDVKAPEIEMENKDIDVKVPDLNIKTPKVNVDESKAGFNINMPNLNIKEKLEGLGRKKVELKGPNIEIEKPEIEMEGQDIDIKAPNLNIKTPKVNIDESIDGFNINMPNVDVKAPEIEMENKDIDVKVPDLNIKTPKVNVDESKAGFNINMPNLNIKEKLEGLGRKKVELKGPNIEIEKPEIEIEGQDIDIKAPNLNIKTPKVNIDESIDGFNINMPNVDVKAPEIEMEGKDIDVKVPDLNIKTPKVNVDESKAGFNINMPNLNIKEKLEGLGRKKVELKGPSIEIEKPEIEMEGQDIDIKASNLNKKTPKVNVDESIDGFNINMPNVDVKAPEIEMEGKDIDVKVPDLNIKTPKVNVDESKAGFNINMPNLNIKEKLEGLGRKKVELKGPNIEIEKPEIEIEGQDIDIKAPNLNIKTPKVNVDESIDGFNINMPNVDVKAPEIKMEGQDIDVKVPDLNIKTPKVNVDESKAGFNINMPNLNIKEKLEGLGRKKVELKGPNIEIEKPEIEIEGQDIDIKAPNLNIKTPKVNVDESIDGFNINMPNVDVKAPEIEMERSYTNLNIPDIDLEIPEMEMEKPYIDLKTPKLSIKTPKVNVDEPIDRFNINMPSLDIKEAEIEMEVPSFDIKEAEIEMEVPSFEVKKSKIEMEVPSFEVKEAEIEMEVPSFEVKEAEIEMEVPSFEVKKPGIEMEVASFDIKEAEIEMEVPSFDIKEPEIEMEVASFDIKKPEIEMEVPSFDIKEAEIEMEVPSFDIKEPEIEMEVASFDIKKPEIEMEVPSFDIKKPEIEMEVPSFDIKEPEIEMEVPSFDIKEPEIEMEVPSFDIKEPEIEMEVPSFEVKEAEIEMEVPSFDIKEPEIEMEVASFDIKKPGIEMEVASFDIKAPNFHERESEIIIDKTKKNLNMNETRINREKSDIDISINSYENIIAKDNEKQFILKEIPLTPTQNIFKKWCEEEESSYTKSILITNKEGFDENSLIKSLEYIVKYHDELRADFKNNTQKIKIMEDDLYEFQVINLEKIKQNKKILKEISRENIKIRSSMDLEKGSLVKAVLYKTQTDQYLLICMHNLIIDNLSWSIIIEDFETAYYQNLNNMPINLINKTASFEEVAYKIDEYKNSELINSEIEFWKQINEKLPYGKLDIEKEQSLIISENEQLEITFPIDKETTSKVIDILGKDKIDEVLLVALSRALKSWTGKDKISLQIERDGRENFKNICNDEINIDRTVGLITNVYPIILENEENVKKHIYKTEAIIQESDKHGLSYGIISQMYEKNFYEPDICWSNLRNMDDGLSKDSKFKLLDYEYGNINSMESNPNCSVIIHSTIIKGILVTNISYEKERFSTKQIEKFALDYINSINEIVKNEDLTNKKIVKKDIVNLNTNNQLEKSYSYMTSEDNEFKEVSKEVSKEPTIMKTNNIDLDIIEDKNIFNVIEEKTTMKNENIKISEEEKEKILFKFNATKSNYRKKTITEVFEEQVERFPNKIAILHEGVSITYKELNNRANAIGRILKTSPDILLKSNEIVAIKCEKGIEMVVAIIAVIKAGGAYVPIDTETSVKRTREIILESKPKIFLTTNDKFTEEINVDVKSINLNNYKKESYEKNIEMVNKLDDLLYIMYTENENDKKGIMISHRGIVNQRQHCIDKYDINANDKIAHLSKYMDDLSVWEIFMSLLTGATIEILDGDKSDNEISNLIYNNEISVAILNIERFKNLEINGLRLVIIKGKDTNENILEKARGNTKYINIYGPSECSISALDRECTRKNIYSENILLGKPESNIQAYIMNENGLCPIGQIGELCISGDCVGAGYYKERELTDLKFEANPFGRGELYRTGDLARYLKDGTIEYLAKVGTSIEEIKINEVISNETSLIKTQEELLSKNVIEDYNLDEMPIKEFKVDNNNFELENLNDNILIEKEVVNIINDDKNENNSELTIMSPEIMISSSKKSFENIDDFSNDYETYKKKIEDSTNNFDNKNSTNKNKPKKKRELKKDDKVIYETNANEDLISKLNSDEVSITKIIDNHFKEYTKSILTKNKTNILSLAPIQKISYEMGIRSNYIEVELIGSLNIERFNKTWIRLLNENSVLRSSISIKSSKDEMIEYEIDDSIKLPYIDISDLSENEKEEIIEHVKEIKNKYVYYRMYTGKQISNLPILIKLEDEKYKLCISSTYLVLDSISNDNIKNRLYEIYNEDIEKNQISNHNYKDYINWFFENNNIKESELKEALDIEMFKDSVKTFKSLNKETDLINLNYEIEWTNSDITEDMISELSQKLYIEILKYNFPKAKIPVIVIKNERKYENADFSDAIGEYIDILPMVIDTEKNEDVIEKIKLYSEFITVNNLNIAWIIKSEKYGEITKAFDEIKFEEIQIPILNATTTSYDDNNDKKNEGRSVYVRTSTNIIQKDKKVIFNILCKNGEEEEMKKYIDSLVGHIFN